MKKSDLIELGFKRTNVSAQDSGDKPFYYYAYDFRKCRGMCLVSNSDDEAGEKGWVVELIDVDRVVFTKKSDLKRFIDIVNKCIVKK